MTDLQKMNSAYREVAAQMARTAQVVGCAALRAHAAAKALSRLETREELMRRYGIKER